MNGGWPPKREQQTPFLSNLFSKKRKERKKLDCLLAERAAHYSTNQPNKSNFQFEFDWIDC